ncbi:MAG: cob(I)yrinic acid a,c-diamide adenosyltransferase [Lachnospiraceae bacterium]
MKGCVHIYCGDGKGKTSAALGLAVRAAGRGRRILLGRFLKNNDSGELNILKTLPGITVYPCEQSFGFVFRMNEKQKAEAALYFNQYFTGIIQKAITEAYDIVILDEIMAACNHQIVDETAVLEFLSARPEHMEVVMTGRQPSAQLLKGADYISEIKMIRHPYEEGLAAREGIEY